MATQFDNREDQGAPQDLRALYLEYRRALHRFFRRHRPAHADDLVQAVYVEVVANGPQGAVRDPIRYLFGIALNLLRSDYRRSARERARFVSMAPQSLDALPVYKSAWSDDSDQDSQVMERIELALARLPESWRIAFLRSRRDGWTYRQIADELHVSPHAVKKYIVKTLAHLRTGSRSTPP